MPSILELTRSSSLIFSGTVVERDEPHRPLSIIVREPPASFRR